VPKNKRYYHAYAIATISLEKKGYKKYGINLNWASGYWGVGGGGMGGVIKKS